MRYIYSHPDHARVGFFKSLLDGAGIDTLVKNDAAYYATSLLDAAPTLCVVNDADYERAREIVRAAADGHEPPAADWKCASCGEEVPGSLETCWNCGSPRNGTAPKEDDHA